MALVTDNLVSLASQFFITLYRRSLFSFFFLYGVRKTYNPLRKDVERARSKTVFRKRMQKNKLRRRIPRDVCAGHGGSPKRNKMEAWATDFAVGFTSLKSYISFSSAALS